MRQTLVALVLLVHSLSILNSAVSGEALSTIFDGYYHGEAQVQKQAGSLWRYLL